MMINLLSFEKILYYLNYKKKLLISTILPSIWVYYFFPIFDSSSYSSFKTLLENLL